MDEIAPALKRVRQRRDAFTDENARFDPRREDRLGERIAPLF